MLGNLLLDTYGYLWVLKKDKRLCLKSGEEWSIWLYLFFLGEFLSEGQRYLENGGAGKKTGLQAAGCSCSSASEEDSQAVPYCRENSPAPPEFSSERSIPSWSCALRILNFASRCKARSQAVPAPSPLCFRYGSGFLRAVVGTVPEFQLPLWNF